MRYATLISLLFLFVLPAHAQGSAQTAEYSDDEAAALQAVVRGYIDGLHRNRDADAVREAFHPDFVMHVHDDGALIQVPLQMWLDHLELDGTKNTSAIDYTVESVDVTGHAATVKLEVYESGAHIYTDHFGLYRFDGAWKIVNKIFYDHDD